MQQIKQVVVPLSGTPAQAATDGNYRASKITAEPLASNTHASTVGLAGMVQATGFNVIRQFPSAAPVTFPFVHEVGDHDELVADHYFFAGTTGDSMLVTFWES